MNRLPILVTIFFQLMFVIAASAQRITGIVQDAKTKQALPYVHIGVLKRNMGVISRDDGRFDINLSPASGDDELIFSMIGYEIRKFKLTELREGRMDVNLIPKTYLLKEVIVRDSKIKTSPVKLGRSKPTKITDGQSGLEEFGFGGEWGLRIFNDGKKYLIKDVQFHLRFNTVDSILFRINIYKIQDDMPGESLSDTEIFVKSYKKKKWIIRGLSDKNLVMDQDLIVTFEVVRIWWDKGGANQLFFTHGSGYERGQTFSRSSSHDQWAINGRSPVTMFLSVIEF